MKKLRKLLYALPVLVALVFAVPPIHTNAADWSTYTVHVTKTGNKYHMAGCSYLSKSDIPINIMQAVNQGYSPCSRCNPPYPSLSTNTDSTVTSNNSYQTTDGITFNIYYDANGNVIQDTLYRGYYASWTAEYYRRLLYDGFNEDVSRSAYEISSFEYLPDNDIEIYASLSDADRQDFVMYEFLSEYDYIVQLLTKNSSIFDYQYYATMYPEKWQSCEYNVAYLLVDFLANGTAQGLQGSPFFNVNVYMNNNPDLMSTFGNNLDKYYTHYRDYGQYEGRIAY